MADFPDDPFSKASSSSPYLHRPNGLLRGEEHPSASNESLATWAKTTRFNVLNHFSHVTSAARNGAHTLLTSPLINQVTGGGAYGGAGGYGNFQPGGGSSSSSASLAMSLLQHGPVGPFGPSDPDWKHSDLAKRSGTGEYDSARVYLAKWANLVAKEGEANRVKEQEEQLKKQRKSNQGSAEAVTADGLAEDEEATLLGPFEILDQHPCIERPAPLRQSDRPIDEACWKGLFDPQGEPLVGFDEVRRMIYQWGFEPRAGKDARGASWSDQGCRAEAWSFLLNVQRWDTKVGSEERKREWEAKVEAYWSLKQIWSASASGQQQCEKGQQPTDPSSEGGKEVVDSLLEPNFIKEQMHRTHVDCLRVDRKLPLFNERASGDEDEPATNAHIQRLQEVLMSYVIWDRSREQAAASAAAENGGTVDEGHNQLGGYVQGMSDLAAPLYSVAGGDEVKTFWLFVGVMERMRTNFYSDQSGMKMQLLLLQRLIAVMDPALYAHFERTDSLNLFFCFRWLLVCFKREFGYPDILKLWEAIWAADMPDRFAGSDEELVEREEEGSSGITLREDASVVDVKKRRSRSPAAPTFGLSPHFHLFVALAILEQHRDVTLKYLVNFDELLHYMNGLSHEIDVEATLARADVLAQSLKAIIEQKDAAAAKKSDSGVDEDMPANVALPDIDDRLRTLVGL